MSKRISFLNSQRKPRYLLGIATSAKGWLSFLWKHTFPTIPQALSTHEISSTGFAAAAPKHSKTEMTENINQEDRVASRHGRRSSYDEDSTPGLKATRMHAPSTHSSIKVSSPQIPLSPDIPKGGSGQIHDSSTPIPLAGPNRPTTNRSEENKKDNPPPIPPAARWTKISSKLVNSEALELGGEKFEAREDFIIVFRVLTRDEVQAYADVTHRIRGLYPSLT
jgi:hypothetical protein